MLPHLERSSRDRASEIKMSSTACRRRARGPTLHRFLCDQRLTCMRTAAERLKTHQRLAALLIGSSTILTQSAAIVSNSHDVSGGERSMGGSSIVEVPCQIEHLESPGVRFQVLATAQQGAGLMHSCCFMVDMHSCNSNNWLDVLFLLLDMGPGSHSRRRLLDG
jgi:hypothetical protein